MKPLGALTWLALIVSFAMTAALKAETNTNTLRVASIKLTDQFNNPCSYEFPRAGVSVLTVADHKGSRQIETWVRRLTERYSKRIAIAGLADVSTVPAPLRPLIRRQFKEKFLYPVMLDWTGKEVRQLKPTSSVVNIYAVNTNGLVLLSLSGDADELKLARLFSVLDAHLPAGSPAIALGARRP